MSNAVHHSAPDGAIACGRWPIRDASSWWHETTCRDCLRRRPEPESELRMAAAEWRDVPIEVRNALIGALNVAMRERFGDPATQSFRPAARALGALMQAALRVAP